MKGVHRLLLIRPAGGSTESGEFWWRESLSRVVNRKFHSGGNGPVFGVGVRRSCRRVAPFLWLAVDEGDAGSDECDELGTGDLAPAGLGRVEQLVGYRESGLAGPRSPGDLGPEAHRREGGLDRVRRPEVDPVLLGEVVVGEEDVELAGDLSDGLLKGGELVGEALHGL